MGKLEREDEDYWHMDRVVRFGACEIVSGFLIAKVIFITYVLERFVGSTPLDGWREASLWDLRNWD